MRKSGNTMKKKRYKVLLLILVNFVVIDLALRLFVFIGLVPYEKHPTSNVKPTFLDDINPVFGVWRYPNASGPHKTVDFDVIYTSNSYGANDRERPQASDAERRVVVLGDSYVEGFGVPREERFTDVLEERSGVEHLNFGTNGCFGPIQEWLLYDSLASTFDHTDVFVFMFPLNDFQDNEPNFYPADRYRPYLRKTPEGFEVYYPMPFEERGHPTLSWTKIAKNAFDNQWYLSNLLRWATRQVKRSREREHASSQPQISNYDCFNALDLERLFHAYESIVAKAGDRRVYFFTVPDVKDFEWALKEGYEFKLVDHMNTFAARFSNVTYVDLLPAFLAHAKANGLQYSDYTFTHDHHWDAIGHALAADILYQAVYEEDSSVAPPPESVRD